MKKHILTVLLISIVLFAYAQPSKTTMLAKVKSEHSKNLISAKLLGNGISERVYEDGKWVNYYRHSYTTTSKTQYQGVTQIYSGSLQYKKNGSAYVYDQLLVGDWNYKGIPNPDKNEVIKMLKSDLVNFVRLTNYNQIIGDISSISFPADPEWRWNKPTMVNFIVNATFSVPISYTEIEKAIHTFNVSLVADEFKGPWVRFVSTENSNLKKSISVSKHTSDEISAMKTLGEINAENQANAILSSLPKVEEPPVFESDKQLFYFVHDKLMTKSANEIKAYLYKLMTKERCYAENSTILLNNHTQKWFDYLFENLEAYKIAHCEYPTVKHYQSGQVEFYDKENRRILRYSGSKTTNSWTINLIEFYAAKANEFDRLKNNNANCGQKPDLTVRKITEYNTGDKVNAKFSNGTFPSFIEKIDPNNRNRYYIKLESNKTGRGYWMEEKFLTARTDDGITETTDANQDTDKEKTDNTNQTQESFNIGDKVQVRTGSLGWLDGEIIRYASRKYLVKFTKNYKDMWVAASNLRKKE